jgi:hypothetical protein
MRTAIMADRNRTIDGLMFSTWLSPMMKHRSIDFDVDEAAPHKWRWKIYPKIEDAPRIIGEELFDSRTSAIDACLTEIVRIEPAILALRRRSRASLRRPRWCLALNRHVELVFNRSRRCHVNFHIDPKTIEQPNEQVEHT